MSPGGSNGLPTSCTRRRCRVSRRRTKKKKKRRVQKRVAYASKVVEGGGDAGGREPLGQETRHVGDDLLLLPASQGRAAAVATATAERLPESLRLRRFVYLWV